MVVVGAGPTGLALALQATTTVHACASSSAAPSRSARLGALIVHPRTLEVLRPLGVTDALLAGGDVSPPVNLHLGRREIPIQLGRLRPPRHRVPCPAVRTAGGGGGRAVGRTCRSRGRGRARGRARRSAGRCHDAVLLLRRSGGVEPVRCRYVAGCDGAGSTVRRLAGVGWHGGCYAQEVVLADVELDGDLAPGMAHVFAGRQGVLFLFAIGERATWRLLATSGRGERNTC